jgi:SAM-dependent methyltransferase
MDWAERITAGIGENLPYQDNSFDGVTTYQTLEHVQDPFKVLSEMVRITRPGGIILIRCPDYTSTFEAHYRLAWMPLMPRFIAKAYLRLRGRPTRGLDAIHYVTKSKIIRWSTKIERESGCRLHLVDSDFIAFSNGLRRRGLFAPLLGYPAYRAAKYLLNVFRREMDVNIAIRVVTKAA